MDKKRNILIGIIIAIIFIILAVLLFISNSNGEIIINDVSGVDNVNLTYYKNNFSLSKYAKGNDEYHNFEGDVIIHYIPSNTDIIFYKSTGSVNNLNNYLINTNIHSKVEEKKTIAGIKGYYIKDNTEYANEEARSGDYFIFVIDNKTYRIGVKEGSLSHSISGIENILSVWIEASRLKQTWDYSVHDKNSNNTNITYNLTSHAYDNLGHKDPINLSHSSIS